MPLSSLSRSTLSSRITKNQRSVKSLARLMMIIANMFRAGSHASDEVQTNDRTEVFVLPCFRSWFVCCLYSFVNFPQWTTHRNRRTLFSRYSIVVGRQFDHSALILGFHVHGTRYTHTNRPTQGAGCYRVLSLRTKSDLCGRFIHFSGTFFMVWIFGITDLYVVRVYRGSLFHYLVRRTNFEKEIWSNV